MNRGKGSIVVDERIVPIVDIYLDDEQIVLVGEAGGPIPAGRTTGYVVCDRGGRAIYRSSSSLDWDEVPPGATATVTVKLAAAGKVSTPQPAVP